MKHEFPAWEAEKWEDYSGNPIIGPVPPSPVIGDPQVILPGEYDGKWHMFLIGRGHFYKFASSDGLKWTLSYDLVWKCGPTCVTSDGGKWFVFYSHSLLADNSICTIKARTSDDLVNWSEPREIFGPELAWEKEGKVRQVRNPWLVRIAEGKWRLYYCGGTVWMDDMDFEEPKYVGFAEADSPLGPFRKRREPILSPDKGNPLINHGSGALKVYRYGGSYLGLLNGLYLDAEGHSRSAIDVLISGDGERWDFAPYNPVIKPSSGWKAALIYQLDLRWHEGRLWLFYNAREGWLGAKEYIGLSRMDWAGTKPEKMWILHRGKGGGKAP